MYGSIPLGGVAGWLTDSGLANPSQPAAGHPQGLPWDFLRTQLPHYQAAPSTEERPGGHRHKFTLFLKPGRCTGPSGPLEGC